ncbi:thiamine pyrophosphate-binding protein [Roseococcus suduntuyensis]|uniref:Sulfopyruvate decarboxylase alpha subunit n=1 Tax=Roseococcus suduntuyensis TaxID=455361 RepID=A0A840ACS2_9PROT|nr:thiamine pyrophosphate-binding protein [Roseococcus suduntuyensis]MBB3898887.1 sulfopyruvate decarboxylase alpha subunit [Roseococcus suduntuyensis]
MTTAAPSHWPGEILAAFKAQDVRLVPYVPDNVLRPLIAAIEADPHFTAFPCAREEEAIGIAAGAVMSGMRAACLMQTSGFATLPNALASLVCAFQLPVVMVVSERGTLGEFNPGQAIVCRTMRPILDSMGIEHHTLSRLDECGFQADRALRQAFATRWPACLILSPLLTARPQ